MNSKFHRIRTLARLVTLWLGLERPDSLCYAATPNPWSVTSSNPTPKRLAQVVYAAGTFVAVGDAQQLGPTLITSTNGIDWVQRNTGFSTSLTSVTYGAGKFVAIGNDFNGGVLVMESADGSQWTTLSKTLPQNITRIAFGEGVFVAAGYPNILWTSTNAIDWKPKQVAASADLNQLRYLNHHFVGVGNGSVLYSSNGEDWLQTPSGTSLPLYDIEYRDGYYWAVGGGLGRDKGIESASADLVNWTTIPITRFDGPIAAISADANNFVAVDSQGHFMWSTNGWRWNQSFTTPSPMLHSMANGVGRFVAVGGNYLNDGTLLSASGPLNWEVIVDSILQITHAATGNGVSLAVGYGGALISSDGSSWKRVQSNSEYLQSRMNGIIFNHGEFLAAADFGRILATPDGVNWSARFTTAAADNMTGIASSHGIVFATSENGIGGSRIFRTSDGTNWTSIASGGMDSFRGIACGDEATVAVGDRGLLMVSTDSKTWTRLENINPLFFFQGVAHGNGHFVAVSARSDAILVSRDGLDWKGSSGLGAIGIAFNNGWFVAVRSGGNGVLISRDGTYWTASEVPTTTWPTGIAALPGRFILFAPSGILSSAWLGGPEVLTSTRVGNGLALLARAQSGKPLALWSSPTVEPAIWTQAQTLTPFESTATFVDLDAFKTPQRFYRIGQTNLAPASIAGRTLEVQVLSGWGMLGHSGAYRFTTSASENKYTIIPIEGALMPDAGTYGYTRLETDVAQITMTNQLGWILRADIHLESPNQGDVSSRILSGDTGEQFGVFVLK